MNIHDLRLRNKRTYARRRYENARNILVIVPMMVGLQVEHLFQVSTRSGSKPTVSSVLFFFSFKLMFTIRVTVVRNTSKYK